LGKEYRNWVVWVRAFPASGFFPRGILLPDFSYQAGRERDYRANQLQHSSYGSAENSERKQYQPNQRIQDQREERKRPAQNEQNAPEQKFQHKWPQKEQSLVFIEEMPFEIFFTLLFVFAQVLRG
jgi:hypothetical protein